MKLKHFFSKKYPPMEYRTSILIDDNGIIISKYKYKAKKENLHGHNVSRKVLVEWEDIELTHEEFREILSKYFEWKGA